MGLFSGDKPYSAVTAIINKIIENHSGELDDGTMELELPELLESIQMQSSGATEAARAIRKKLKYGSDKEKLNALQVFELLVANGGKRLSAMHNDSRLLDRFKMLVMDKTTNPAVRRQAILMVIGWHREYSDKNGYKGLTDLHRQLPMDKFVKKKKKVNVDFMADEADDSTPFEVIGGSDSTDSDTEVQQPFRPLKKTPKQSRKLTNQEINRQYKIPRINYVKERPKINQLIADASSSSIKLSNSLQSLRLDDNPTRNKKCSDNFDKCRETRRKILRYLQLVDHEEFLGPLIHANEELIEALQKYSQAAEKFVDEESESESDYDYDSEFDDEESQYTRTEYSSSEDEVDSLAEQMQRTQIKKKPPPVPPKSPKLLNKFQSIKSNNRVFEDVEDDDPFGDNQKTEYPARWS